MRLSDLIDWTPPNTITYLFITLGDLFVHATTPVSRFEYVSGLSV